MKIPQPAIEDLELEAFAILRRELGVVGAMRLYMHWGLGSGNYTEDRHQWLKDFTMADYDRALAEVREERTAATAESP
jgi:hypothetical protein